MPFLRSVVSFFVVLITSMAYAGAAPPVFSGKPASKTGFDAVHHERTVFQVQEVPGARQAVARSLTVLVNDNARLPLADLEKGSFAVLTVGQAEFFATRLNDYLAMEVVNIDPLCIRSYDEAFVRLSRHDRIIAGITAAALPANPDNRILSGRLTEFLAEKEATVVFFGPLLFLGQWGGIDGVPGLLWAGNDTPLAQDLSAQALFGAIATGGNLPEAAGSIFEQGHGIATPGGWRLAFSVPGEAGIDGRMLQHRVDSIVKSGLEMKAFPGCRVLAAVNGKVIFDKAWGHHTYDRRVAVHRDDLYDLASVTKISGPLPLYMKLVDEGRLDLDMPLSHYWDDWENRLFRRSNKEDILLRDLLTHQSGIVPYINYWERTVRRGHYIRRWYRLEPAGRHNTEIGTHLYLRDDFRDRVYRDIRRSDLFTQGEYRYSCLPFIVSPEVLSRVDGRPYTEALYDDFFRPLGAGTLRYNPRRFFSLYRIVPTETDNNFRRKVVHGYVHDEAAAVLGGVSGNAGLFSSAVDLAKLLQMYLNGGEYGGRRYLSEEVIAEFTRVQFPENDNRRGIGFDKPVPDNADRSPERAYPCRGASPSSFGHSGFTGTFVWMDPEHDLLYIFLSNRVHPTRDNNLISIMNIRTEILQVFYDALNTALTK
ncbi:MAG: hypothetical protein EA408_09380 [Marinilabiliales bacterium]|nr:MAG: hypothetical protein EA408_09380 [Marinilabiliales bacterium]